MILKLLLVLVVIAIVYFMFIKKSPLSRSKKKKEKEKESKLSSEEMTACTHCGTYISVNDAIIKGGHYYCSSECLEK